MSDSKTSPNGAKKTTGRNLPSWMGSKENASKTNAKNPTDGGVSEESNADGSPMNARESGKAPEGSTPSKENDDGKRTSKSGSGAASFSRLMEGVVFVLSGFVNPERGILRSQALEMGAEYQADWNPDCTLLVCAFPNTPKFRQVKAEGGTIVSKDWISVCYMQKKLVDVESYLMHAGKSWKRQSLSHEPIKDQESSVSRESQLIADQQSHSSSAAYVLSKSRSSNPAIEHFSPLKLKKWAIDDLTKTVSWLESQEEKPEESEIKKIAAEGILTCIQDAIDSLERKQDMQQMIEQWNFLPRVVEELAKLEKGGNGSTSFPREELFKQAMVCKQIYEAELKNSEDDSTLKKRKQRTVITRNDENKKRNMVTYDAEGYDSDETIEMTEEEIGLAYNSVASKLCK